MIRRTSPRIEAIHQGLQEWGQTLGRNTRIDVRWGANDADSSRRYATELVALAPEVILVSAAAGLGALKQTTRTVPIVFVNVVDPVGAGYVESLSLPAETSPDLPRSSTASVESGSSCSKRSRPA